MNALELIDHLKERFGEKVTGEDREAIDPWVEVAPDGLVEICRYLRDDSQLQFDVLNCVTAVDFFEPDEKKAKRVSWEPHIDVVYHLSSIPNKTRCVVKVRLPRWKDDVEGRLPEIPSVVALWITADWHEREVFDLSGVRFVGHPDLRRILCPEDWIGHPLRKDYQMPEEYHGIRNS